MIHLVLKSPIVGMKILESLTYPLGTAFKEKAEKKVCVRLRVIDASD